MNFEFNLPDIGEGLVEGEIVKWFVKVGETVSEHQPIAAVLTDKAEVEIPSPKAGKIVALHGKPGEKIKVHTPLATIEISGGGAAEPAKEKVAVKNSVAAPKAPQASATAVVERPAPASGAGVFVFNLPDIGEGLVEGELVKWFVKEGANVEENQPIAAVLTDKAEVEIPSPKTGTITKLHAKPGEKVKVHSPLVTYGGVKGSVVTSTQSVTADSPKAAAAPAAPRPSKPASEVLATPMVRKMAKDQGIDIGQVQGSGPEGRVLASDLSGFKAGAPAAATPSRGGSYDNSKANATPAVKKLATDLGVDLSRVTGTGPGGRISETDVRAKAPLAPAAPTATATTRQEPAIASTTSTGSGYAPVSIARQNGDTTVPFSGIRRKIAEKMQQSRRTVAHVTHVDECDMTAVLALREKLKPEAAKKGIKLTFLPFIVRALSKALSEFPMFNSSLDEAAGEIVIKRRHNVGIAVAAPQGLVVPNIKAAQDKDIWALATEISTLAEKVRAKTIEVANLQDGTVTITNIGPIGGLFATPIVNHPEVAILGLMKLGKRPVVRDGKVVARDLMNRVLSFDHRIVDGADAASIMNTIIKHLENPQTLL
ncbi:MAG: 2-oxo acid dehydrogenase subunit E2 [Elusimicrobia bacterium]|nr:2-oxo acid dehydrogenase subunit E2 [Elusimicrobiota bacterium]